MLRRGLTLLELLVAMVLFVIVASLVMMVFSNQNRSFKTESDKAEVALMAKGTLDELTHAVRMTGGNLPDSTVGMTVWGTSQVRATFAMNDRAGIDTLTGSYFDAAKNELRVGIRDASRFSHQGYAMIPLAISPSTITKNQIVPIVDRMTSMCGDSIVLDVSALSAVAIATTANSPVYNVDFVTYRKQNDTLYQQRNGQKEQVFATGIDALRFQYWHPIDGWQDSLSGTAPANRIDKVGIRLVVRNQSVDAKLKSRDSSSRGYHFSVLETEVSLRNTRLINK